MSSNRCESFRVLRYLGARAVAAGEGSSSAAPVVMPGPMASRRAVNVSRFVTVFARS